MKTREKLAAEYQVNLRIVIGALSSSSKKNSPLAVPDEIELIESPSHGRVNRVEEKEDAEQETEKYINETIGWFQALLSPSQEGIPSWEDVLKNHRNFIIELEKHLQSTDFVSAEDQAHQIYLPYIGAALDREVTQEDVDIREEDISSVASATRSKDALAKRAVSALHAFFIVVEDEAQRITDKDLVKAILLPQATQQAYDALRACLETIQNSSGSAAELDHLRSEALKNFNNALVKNLRDNLHLNQKTARKHLQAGEELAAWEQRSLKPVVTLKQISGTHNVVVVEEPIINHRALLKALAFLDNDKAKKPKWFQRLNPVKKSWLRKNKHRLEKGELACPSSLTNDIPGVANFARHTFAVYEGERLVSRYSSIRRRTPTPMSFKSKNKRRIFAAENARDILDEAKPTTHSQTFWEDHALAQALGSLHVDQSLVSPILAKWSPIDLLSSRFNAYKENNMIMRDNAREAFKKVKKDKDPEAKEIPDTLYTENYPINLMQLFSHGIEYNNKAMLGRIIFVAKACDHISEQLEDTDAAGKFKAISETLKGNNPKNVIIGLNRLAIDLWHSKDTWASELFKNDSVAKSTALCMAIDALAQSYTLFNDSPNENGNNLNVFAAAYSRLMVQGFGGTVSGGCKSAKDREAIVQLHTDAMAVFYAEKGYLPKYSDDPHSADRKRFVEIMADLFDAGYEQYAANLTAFGNYGIQDGTPSFIKWLIKTPDFVRWLGGKLINVSGFKGLGEWLMNAPGLGRWLGGHLLIPQDLQAKIRERHPKEDEYEAQQSIAKTRKLEISTKGESINFKKGFVIVGGVLIQIIWLPLMGTFYLGKGILWDIPKWIARGIGNAVLGLLGRPPLLSNFAQSVKDNVEKTKAGETTALDIEEQKEDQEKEMSDEEEVEEDAGHGIEMQDLSKPLLKQENDGVDTKPEEASDADDDADDENKDEDEESTSPTHTTAIPPPPHSSQLTAEAQKESSESFVVGKHSVFPPASQMKLTSPQVINLNGLDAVLTALCKIKNENTAVNGKWKISENHQGVSIHRPAQPGHRLTSMQFFGHTLTATRPSDPESLKMVCKAMVEVMAAALGEKAHEATIEITATNSQEKTLLEEACQGKFKNVRIASTFEPLDSKQPPSQTFSGS